MKDEDIYVGAQLYLSPSIDSACGVQDIGPRLCEVVRIHPERRFFTVEFRFRLGSFRETFYFPGQGENTGSSDHKPRFRF